jgi:hypothetical protein
MRHPDSAFADCAMNQDHAHWREITGDARLLADLSYTLPRGERPWASWGACSRRIKPDCGLWLGMSQRERAAGYAS